MRLLLQTSACLLLLLLGVMRTSQAHEELSSEGRKARFVRTREDEDVKERVRRALWIGLKDLRLPLKNLELLKQQHKEDPHNVKKTSRGKTISQEKERESLELAASHLREREALESELTKRNLSLAKGSPSEMFQKGFKKSHPFTAKVAKQGSLYVMATAELAQRLGLSKEFVAFDLPSLGTLSETDEFCDEHKIREKPTDCEAYRRYRSIDGTCNNVNNALWGATMTPLLRYLPPFYDDGVSAFRKARDGEDLPNPRFLSAELCLKRNVESTSMSLLHMTYGQFLDHDLDFSPVVKGEDGKDLPCCPDVLGDDPSLIHPDCAPIAIPADDPFYAPFNQTCMEFVRSVADSHCELGPRMQINEKTSYLDGSVIYGTDKEQSDSLRTFKEGMLMYQLSQGEELLPANTNMSGTCNKMGMAKEGHFCFKSGDMRVNVQPLLTAFHILWARQHNHLTRILLDLNPHWDDEKLFQETRRIVVAQLQHVTYKEYISSVLGCDLMKKFNLRPLKGEQRTKLYSAGINAAISAPFSGAAFRFGHSQIPGNLQEMDRHGDASSTAMSSVFMKPFSLYNQGTLTNMMRGELAQSSTHVDPFFSPQVAGKLFRGEMPFGLDLVALNVQRGRDHGLPPYTAMRTVCNLRPVSSFEDLQPDLQSNMVEQLEKLYSHVDDIDLFIGGLAERPVPGGLVGPTFACILADQFFRLKVGDRYWYETDDPDTQFTPTQLVEIRKSSLARILCDVIPELKEVQINPLRKMSDINPLVPCSDFKKVCLHPWQE
ncbi:peroxidase-like isoform X1 [Penaeus japonicus]|uniref:peroxidase-like isoform X1 n=1 Tax=Penaeus japonicus TaxID=27405 RepID=UPI001C71270B|nr:peroxidase-like isoform X1 [Penaeus japonicus]XP_042893247.1 peroxidase-like isoform X1 [Penaeus japonicus]XP_042893249.1 peroxidase-like isoform X1 [Penaeus japonicus]